MVDTSNALPPAGYTLPLLGRFRSALGVVADQILGVFDRAFERARVAITGLRAMHHVGTAVGPDLDDLGALLGLGRLPGEDDTNYRVRLPATVQHGVSASVAGDLVALLEASFGVPVIAEDSGGAAEAMITFQGWTPLLPSAMGLITRYKAAGVLVHAQVVLSGVPDYGSSLAGEFLSGEETLGGTSNIISLG